MILNDWLKLIPYGSAIFISIIISEYLHRVKKTDIKNTRKIVHFTVGILTMMTPFIFNDPLPLITISIIFIFGNAMIMMLNIFKGMGAERRTYGTVLFPLTFVILLLLYWDNSKFLVFYGIALLTFADGFASLIGETLSKVRLYKPVIDAKSIEGSSALIVTTAVITLLMLLFKPLDFPDITLPFFSLIMLIVLMGVISLIGENLSAYGSDNLSLPLLGTFFFNYALINHHFYTDIKFLIAFVILLLTAFISIRKKWLNIGGMLAMLLLGLSIAFFTRPRMLVPIFLFFILSSSLSKVKEKIFNIKPVPGVKGSERDVYQVFANGGVATVFAVLYYFHPSFSLIIAYAASIAAATADTWGTEIGFFSHAKPRLLVGFKKVDTGTSGGVTFAGTLGGIFGAFIIAVSMFFIFPCTMNAIFISIIVLGGIVGSFIDSLSGQLLQVQYKCRICGKITEHKVHCGKDTEYFKGQKIISNDLVNVICTLTGGLTAYLISMANMNI